MDSVRPSPFLFHSSSQLQINTKIDNQHLSSNKYDQSSSDNHSQGLEFNTQLE